MSVLVQMPMHSNPVAVTQWLNDHVSTCTYSGTVSWAGEGWVYKCNVFNTPTLHTVWFHDLVHADVITQFMLTWS